MGNFYLDFSRSPSFNVVVIDIEVSNMHYAINSISLIAFKHFMGFKLM